MSDNEKRYDEYVDYIKAIVLELHGILVEKQVTLNNAEEIAKQLQESIRYERWLIGHNSALPKCTRFDTLQK